ncbi:MAG TPA: tetratricopeptide repeat protein [Candidatus Acidoferrales bacterium]
MKLRLPTILALLLLVPVCARAQFGQQEPASVVVRVTSESGEALETSAEVSLTPAGGGFGQELMTNGNPEVQFNVTEQGRYEVEVKATGYKTERTTLEVDGTRHAFFMNVTLEPDSASAGMNPNADLLSPKAQKEMEKGVGAIKSRNYQAKKHLLEAQKAAPGDSNINYLLGFTLLELKEYDDAQKYLLVAITLDGKNSAALVTMGRLRLEMGNPSAAVEPLQRALSSDATNWRAHWLLADTYRIEADYEKSLQEAQLAIESGKGAAEGARIALGPALAGLGKKEEAIKTLQDFVSKAPDGAAKQYAEQQIVSLEAQVAAAQLETQTAPNVSTVSAPAAQPTSANAVEQQGAVAMQLADATATLPSWQPASVA